MVFGGGRTEKSEEEDVNLGLSEIPICNSSSSSTDAEVVKLGEVFDWDFGGGSERKGDEEVDFGGGRDEKAPVGFEELERSTSCCSSSSSEEA